MADELELIMLLAEAETTVVYEWRNDEDDNHGFSGGGSVWFGPSWSSGTDSGPVTSFGGETFGEVTAPAPQDGPPATDTVPTETTPPMLGRRRPLRPKPRPPRAAHALRRRNRQREPGGRIRFW